MFYLWLKLFHVLAILLLAVGDVGSLLVAIRARRATTSRDALTLMQTHHFTVVCGIIPGAIGSLVTGFALVAVLKISYAAPWIAGAAGAWLASLIIGLGVLVPAENKAIREAQRLVDSGAGAEVPSEDLRRFIGAPHVWIGEWATVVLLVAMTVLMIFKPV